MRNNSISLFISEGLSARTLRTIMPGYLSGGYKRIFAKSWSRVMMTLFSLKASDAISESGDTGGRTSLTSMASCPKELMTAFVERGILASIRNFKRFLSPIKHYFFFLCKYGCILDTCPDILIRNRRIFCLDLLIGHSCGKGIEDNKNWNTCSFNTGFPVTYSRVYRYSFNCHNSRILNSLNKSKLTNENENSGVIKMFEIAQLTS